MSRNGKFASLSGVNRNMPIHTNRHYLVVLAFCIRCSVGLHAEEPGDAFREGFEKSGSIIVPAQIMGRNVTCMLDTGASICVLDKRFAARLQKPVGTEQVLTASGLMTVEQYEGISQHFMTLPHVTGPAIASDLSRMTSLVGIELDAVFGMDLLKRSILQFSNGTPRFRNRNDVVFDGMSFPVTTIRRCPYIAVGLPVLGERPFLIDTGWASYCGITKDYADRLIRTNDAIFVDETIRLDASGVRQKNAYVIREVNVLGIRIYDVPAVESEVNLIGLGIMRQLECSVDFENSVAYVHKSSTGRVSFDVDASGLRTVTQPDSRVIVHLAMPDSSAVKNNIQAGDQLLEIEGHAASSLAYWEIRRLLSQAGKTIPLKVKSGDQVRDIQLPLRRNFEYPPKWKPRSTDAEDFLESLENEAKS